VCSTGLIGIPLPMAPLERGIPAAAAALAPGADAGRAAADAMLTTDTRRKEALAVANLTGGGRITVGGMAKGAAMLAPAMATMLAVLTTDAAAPASVLHAALEAAVADTFNALVVDGCTSTNDTVLLLASGKAGAPADGDAAGFRALVGAVTEVCDQLAAAMAADAEGATKLARVVVRGASSSDEARRAARAVAASQLVQCSLYGCDPYWGRVLSELGASGATFDPEHVDIAYNGITVCREGIATPHDESALTTSMAKRDITIDCDLHQGSGEAFVRFTDLTHAYIDENRGTS
jgi:glutamate N-acetyltransferase/amino-acid N-acetyltransferase